MFSLQDLLGQEQGEQAVQEISSNVGADPSIVNTAIQTALPMLLNGLANNASTPDGAESLNNALEQHHDGSILDNIGGLAGMIFGGGQGNAASPAADAGGILGHILGSNQGAVAQQVSQRSGLGTGQVAQILMFLAPIVMGYLGRQKASRALTPAAWADFSAGFWAVRSLRSRLRREIPCLIWRRICWTATTTAARSTTLPRWRSSIFRSKNRYLNFL